MTTDALELPVALGGRVLVVADLLLTRTSTPSSEVATAELAIALAAWEGPGAVIVAGGLFDLLGDPLTTPASALAAHPRLTAALASFGRDGRQVVCLPGAHDARLAWDERAQRELAADTGAGTAVAVDALVATGQGERRVRIESGTRFDTRFALADPHSPVDTPLGSHVVSEIVPELTGAWAAGAGHLHDVSLLPSFVASRVLYRRIGRWAWTLLVPFVLAVAVKVPLWRRLALPIVTTVVDLALVAVVVAALLVRGWRVVVGRVAPGPQRNAASRDEARRLIGEGYTGLVVAHTRVAEITNLGTGFFANVGQASEAVVERPARLALPPVFVPERVVSWVELEAGAELHARLLYSRVDVPGATILERLAARPATAEPRPRVVGAFPSGESWPLVASVLAHRTAVRRRAATAIAVAGLFDIVSAITPPFEERLSAVLRWVPLAVPETATAAVALAGIGLLALARGVRRGQRDAWRVAVALLVGSSFLHVVKGADVEEAVVAAVVAAYLVAQRRSFSARSHWEGVRRAAVRVLVAVPVAVAGATAAIEVATARRGHALPVRDALVAAAGRLVGVRTVALPEHIDDFVSPALFAVGFGLAAALAWIAIRPAAARRASHDEVARARSLVGRWGTGTLDYFALRDDKDVFFSGSTLVAYAVQNGVCLVSPDPIGPEWERDAAWDAFRRFADDHGWALAVLGAGDEWLPVYRASGMHDLYVGDEAVVDIERFSLEGGRHKSLRQAVNRIAKYGYTMSFHDPAAAAPELQQAVRDVMGKSRRGDVERGFSMTLGRVFDPADRDLLLAVCHGPDGTPVAFCQFVPAPGLAGYSLDLMRRDAGEHPNGLLDFVIVETIRHLQDRGLRRLGLNFSTMRAVLAGETGAGVVTRVERWALRRMSGSMQIESLWRFNAKFDPDWLPRYVVFDSPEHVMAVALAVARAESFWELPVIGRFLVPRTAVERVAEG